MIFHSRPPGAQRLMTAKSEHNNGYTETYSWDIR